MLSNEFIWRSLSFPTRNSWSISLRFFIVTSINLAISTWPKNIIPVVHYSESKSLHESNDKIKPQAHSDYITKIPNTYGNDVDIMVESKAKELSIILIILTNRLN